MYKSIFFAVNEPIKNIGNIRNYFIANTETFVTFHFFHGYSDKASYVEKYKNGTLVARKVLPVSLFKHKNFKIFLHYLYFQIILFFYVDRESFVIVDNPIFCFLQSIHSFIKNQKFVFLIGDYFPEHTGFMWLYNKMADFYNIHSLYVIYLSPPIEKIYSSLRNKKLHRTQLSLGIADLNVARSEYFPTDMLRVGYMGSIRHGQGLGTLFKYIKHASVPIHLDIIGDGYELNFYKSLVNTLEIEDKVTFHGFALNREEIASSWHIAFALYDYHPSNVSLYCEPTKIKDYLSYGLPVITTKTTYFHKEIIAFGAGEIVEENSEDIDRAVLAIMSAHSTYKQGVKNIIKEYEYVSRYNRQLVFLQSHESAT
jgi:glycosyltransferase involved in cell wall biosynthesis